MQRRKRVCFSTFSAALGGLLFGFDTAVISGTVGAFTVGKPADVIGRRRVLMALGVFYFVSALGSALAQSWIPFLIYRFIGGLAVGGASVAAPMYIAEIAPSKLRGRLVMVNQLNVVTGILLAFLSNFVVAQIIDDSTAWRWMFGVEAAPAALFFVSLFFIPFSPRWLVKQGQVDEARVVLSGLGEERVEQKLQEIVASLRRDMGRLVEALFKREYAFPISLAMAVAMFNQLSGINALMYYAPSIFEQAGAASTRHYCRPLRSAGPTCFSPGWPCSESTGSGGGRC